MLGSSSKLASTFWNYYSLYEKCPNTEIFSRPYFPIFGLNTEIYGVTKEIASLWIELSLGIFFNEFNIAKLVVGNALCEEIVATVCQQLFS